MIDAPKALSRVLLTHGRAFVHRGSASARGMMVHTGFANERAAQFSVIPAQAGIQFQACACEQTPSLDSRLRGNDEGVGKIRYIFNVL
jgi:hypothetical protein